MPFLANLQNTYHTWIAVTVEIKTTFALCSLVSTSGMLIESNVRHLGHRTELSIYLSQRSVSRQTDTSQTKITRNVKL